MESTMELSDRGIRPAELLKFILSSERSVPSIREYTLGMIAAAENQAVELIDQYSLSVTKSILSFNFFSASALQKKLTSAKIDFA
jgi:hypothetical protein